MRPAPPARFSHPASFLSLSSVPVRLSRSNRAKALSALGLSLCVLGTTASAQPRPAGVPAGAVRVKTKVPDSIAASLPKTLKLPTSDKEVLAQRDLRARNVLGYFDCLARTVKASREGQLGIVPAGAMLVCVQEKGEWRGVVAEILTRPPGIVVGAQYAMRKGGSLVRAPIDTQRVLVLARGQRRAVQATSAAASAAGVLPAVLPYESFLEILYAPVPDAANGTLFIGGDSVIQMARDGSRELGHSRAAPPITKLTVNTGKSGEALLQSTQAQVPLVSELVAARALLPRFRVVKLQSADYVFTLTRTTPQSNALPDGMWSSAPR